MNGFSSKASLAFFLLVFFVRVILDVTKMRSLDFAVPIIIVFGVN